MKFESKNALEQCFFPPNMGENFPQKNRGDKGVGIDENMGKTEKNPDRQRNVGENYIFSTQMSTLKMHNEK